MIWIIFLALCLISIIEVFSAASTLTYKSGDHWGPITQHTILLSIGALIVVLVHNIPYKWFQMFPYPLLLVSVILLAAHCEYFSKQVSVDLYELLHRYGASLKLLDSGFNNVMHQLANYNYIHFMEYILKHDPIAKSLCDEVNASCVTPACLAMYNGFYTMAKLMIEMGLPLRPSESAVALTNNR